VRAGCASQSSPMQRPAAEPLQTDRAKHRRVCQLMLRGANHRRVVSATAHMVTLDTHHLGSFSLGAARTALLKWLRNPSPHSLSRVEYLFHAIQKNHNGENTATATSHHRSRLWGEGEQQVDHWILGSNALAYLALAALATIIVSIIAAAGVLARSNGQPVRDWSVSPSVCLAIISAFANIALHFALTEGARIAWWLKASRGGTIQDLHNH
jgi:hypothetical protein